MIQKSLLCEQRDGIATITANRSTECCVAARGATSLSTRALRFALPAPRTTATSSSGFELLQFADHSAPFALLPGASHGNEGSAILAPPGA
jgi:hypothetical protein